jgi:hypothetical protein
MKMRCEYGPCDGVEIAVRPNCDCVAVPVPNDVGRYERYTIHRALGLGLPRLLHDPI